MSAWDSLQLVDFEDTKLYVMGGYDEFLRVFFRGLYATASCGRKSAEAAKLFEILLEMIL